jgi:NDP-sugar pyrophosphorylase family protein
MKTNAKRTKKEKDVEAAYNVILKKVIEPMSGDEATYLDELNAIGKKIFGVKFKGVFSSDKIPKLNDLSPYAILNLDSSKQSGSHWVSIAKYPNENKTLLYDSFARKGSKIIPSLYHSGNGRIIDSDRKDREQEYIEQNCGARALSFLVVVEKYGPEVAQLI